MAATCGPSWLGIGLAPSISRKVEVSRYLVLCVCVCNRTFAAGGVGSGRGIKRVDYSGLLAQANAHRATAHLQETKLKSLRKQRRELKEGSLLHLHQEVWHHEWARLVSEGLRVEGEVEEWRCDILAGVGGETCDWVKEISSYMATLYQDEGKMAEQESLHGIQQLQIELKRWLNISACPEAERGPLPPPWTHLQEALDAVKQEVTQVQDTLQEQAMSLWHDLVCYQDTHLNGNSESWTREDPVGNLEYSDTRFKQSLVKEFDNLNSHYQLILQQLERRHEQAIRCVGEEGRVKGGEGGGEGDGGGKRMKGGEGEGRG